MTATQAQQLTFDNDILLDTGPGVFTPNATTSVSVNAVANYLKAPCKMLDLGSGTGAVGIALAAKGLSLPPLYASDISENAMACLKENCKRYAVPVETRVGSLLEPWRGERFDCIVDTVSTIAEEAARLSPWYNGISCDAGEDGVKLAGEILREAPEHLNEGGMIFFPVVSLSNVEKLLAAAQAGFNHVEFLERQVWPLPPSMYEHLDALNRLKKQGHIQLDKQFGMIVCFTDIYVACNR